MEDGRDNDQFKGMCLEKKERGSDYIHCYDDLPPLVRKRLRDSPFNLCPACIQLKILGVKPNGFSGYTQGPPKEPFQAIQEFEQEIRRQDAHGL